MRFLIFSPHSQPRLKTIPPGLEGGKGVFRQPKIMPLGPAFLVALGAENEIL